jgi:uncharacterized membrane protein YccC
VYEHRTDPLLPWRHFRRRALRHAGQASLVLLGALFLGMAIYHWTERLDWVESFLNASMVLGGMGPVDDPKTTAGKILAGSYALLAGLVFVSAVGYMGAPWLHRLLHRLHLETGGDGTPRDRSHRPSG